MPDYWMMSNRQPWVEALLRGWISCKTRKVGVPLPPPGAVVFLHAGKAKWPEWDRLYWMRDGDLAMDALDYGGVCGVAKVRMAGPTKEIMPDGDKPFFDLWPNGCKSCAAAMCIVFHQVRRLRSIPCPGTQLPTRKIPLIVRNLYCRG